MSLKNPEFAKAIQEFLGFMEAQKGAYSDACAGFRNNHQDISRQVSRVMKPTGRKLDSKGIPSIVHTTVEDPSAPDVVVRSTRLSSDFLSANARSGGNEQQLCRAIIIFLYTYWDNVTRFQCANALGIPKNDVKLAIAGDLRLIRHSILHDKGVLIPTAHKKIEVLGEYFRSGAEILFSHEKMHHIFRLLDKGVAQLTLEVLDVPNPPGGWEGVTQIAIGSPPKR